MKLEEFVQKVLNLLSIEVKMNVGGLLICIFVGFLLGVIWL